MDGFSFFTHHPLEGGFGENGQKDGGSMNEGREVDTRMIKKSMSDTEAQRATKAVPCHENAEDDYDDDYEYGFWEESFLLDKRIKIQVIDGYGIIGTLKDVGDLYLILEVGDRVILVKRDVVEYIEELKEKGGERVAQSE